MSSEIDRLNRTTNRYLDVEKLIEYIFVGFTKIVPIDEKKKLIAKLGTPRRVPLEDKKIQSGPFEFTLSNPYPAWEMQVISPVFNEDDKEQTA